MLLLLDPPLAYAQLALGRHQPGCQGCTALEEHADESQQVAQQFDDASKTVPQVSKQVDDSVHTPLIAEEASDGNRP